LPDQALDGVGNPTNNAHIPVIMAQRGHETLTLLAPLPAYSFMSLPSTRQDLSPAHEPNSTPLAHTMHLVPLAEKATVQAPTSSSTPSESLVPDEASLFDSVSSPASSPRSGSPDLPEEVGPWCFDPRTDAKTLKWWSRRYELFTRYDYGIRIDREGWYEATPESLAEHIAKKMTTKGVIVDGFCGVGGNTIAFSKLGVCSQVVAADLDADRVEMCRHNAAVYGFDVEQRIDFVDGSCDFRRLAPAYCLQQLHIGRQGSDPCRAAQWVFLSPPWGERCECLAHPTPLQRPSHMPSQLLRSLLISPPPHARVALCEPPIRRTMLSSHAARTHTLHPHTHSYTLYSHSFHRLGGLARPQTLDRWPPTGPSISYAIWAAASTAPNFYASPSASPPTSVTTCHATRALPS
jgi:hypothetical protein